MASSPSQGPSEEARSPTTYPSVPRRRMCLGSQSTSGWYSAVPWVLRANCAQSDPKSAVYAMLFALPTFGGLSASMTRTPSM
eukprot:scaffold4285_cov109-Isochrysis_galbana.AAC.8